MQKATAEPHPHPKACPALSADGLCVAQKNKPSICATYFSKSLPLCTDLMNAFDGASKAPDHPPAIGHGTGWLVSFAVNHVLTTLTGVAPIYLDLKTFLRAKQEGHDSTTAMRLAFRRHDAEPAKNFPLRIDTRTQMALSGIVVPQELSV
jgi:hypothetical protein